MNKQEALQVLYAAAAKRGMTLQEFMDTELRRILEKAWEIQNRTGQPVPIAQLCRELNESAPGGKEAAR